MKDLTIAQPAVKLLAQGTQDSNELGDSGNFGDKYYLSPSQKKEGTFDEYQIQQDTQDDNKANELAQKIVNEKKQVQ